MRGNFAAERTQVEDVVISAKFRSRGDRKNDSLESVRSWIILLNDDADLFKIFVLPVCELRPTR
jgi:hypothetical protein